MRPRAIVALAASRVEDPNTSDWLRADMFGTWEKTASDYLDSTRERAVSLDMTPEQVDDAIADRLVIDALKAQLAHQKKKRAK